MLVKFRSVAKPDNMIAVNADAVAWVDPVGETTVIVFSGSDNGSVMVDEPYAQVVDKLQEALA